MSRQEKAQIALMVTGGIDSTLMMYEQAERDPKPVLLSVNYGQIVWDKQKELINHHAKILGYDPVVEIPVKYYPWQMVSKGLFEEGYVPKQENPLEEWDTIPHKDFLIQGRNAIMLLYAIGYCASQEIDEIWLGYQRDNKKWTKLRSFKGISDDTNPLFVDTMNLLIVSGFSYYVRIRAPFYDRALDKKSIIKLCLQAGINLDKTYSCYFLPKCGKCDNCMMIKEVMEEIKREENTDE